MTNRAPLRAVGKDEKPAEKASPKSVAQAAKSGTQRELLVAMRDRVAEAVTDTKCPARELASLTKRLQDITRDIDAMDAREDDGDRVRKLESALRELDPSHPLIGDVADDAFDASAI
ncbi:hypothetical protein [Mycolicibacterium austroafricanum]|uniref:hypothetical protein n=1 Tax=Mycolicibacterium austroafricanum TaxID=39687 RepID=UPI001ABF6024|nr:hypothetical protein [Mycolicibacterium austroafricanum]QRZ05900.1 hypothetical protein JN090_23725 [Mycolicibacterium austroafricanum]